MKCSNVVECTFLVCVLCQQEPHPYNFGREVLKFLVSALFTYKYCVAIYIVVLVCTLCHDQSIIQSLYVNFLSQ